MGLVMELGSTNWNRPGPKGFVLRGCQVGRLVYASTTNLLAAGPLVAITAKAA